MKHVRMPAVWVLICSQFTALSIPVLAPEPPEDDQNNANEQDENDDEGEVVDGADEPLPEIEIEGILLFAKMRGGFLTTFSWVLMKVVFALVCFFNSFGIFYLILFVDYDDLMTHLMMRRHTKMKMRCLEAIQSHRRSMQTLVEVLTCSSMRQLRLIQKSKLLPKTMQTPS